MAMVTGGYQVGKMDILTKKAENQRDNKSWTLLYMRSGSGMYICEGKLFCLNESDVLVFPPRVSYSFVPADLGDEYNVSVDAVVVRFEEAWTDLFLRAFPGCSDIVLALKEMKTAMSVTGTKWFKLSGLMDKLSRSAGLVEAVTILEIFQQIAENSDMLPFSTTRQPINEIPDISEKKSRIDRYISCNLLRNISLDAISAYAGMNKTYFCLFFKKHYGMRFIDYLNGRKIELACRLLSDPRNSVSDIARQCGFTSVTYFNRVFKAAKGVSPTEHRNSSCS